MFLFTQVTVHLQMNSKAKLQVVGSNRSEQSKRMASLTLLTVWYVLVVEHTKAKLCSKSNQQSGIEWIAEVASRLDSMGEMLRAWKRVNSFLFLEVNFVRLEQLFGAHFRR